MNNSFNTHVINNNYVVMLYLVNLVLKHNFCFVVSHKCYIFALPKLNNNNSALDITVKSTTMAKEFGNIYAEDVGYPQTIPALRVEIYEDGYEVEERIIPVTKNQQRYVMSLTREKRVKYISKKIEIN